MLGPKFSRGLSSLAYQSLRRAARNQLDQTSLIDVTRLPRPVIGNLAELPSEAFRIYPHFLSADEQRILLSSSLAKLGGKRRRRNRTSESQPTSREQTLGDVFGTDSDYSFEEGHFDGVIHDYREMTVSSWPESSPPELTPILLRLYNLIDPQNTPPNPGLTIPPNIQTHILHLASTGVILPHVDNVEASGRVIAGVSLGDSRVLRLSRQGENDAIFDVLLESGSVYVQRDDVRYEWKHEIPNTAEFQGRVVGGGQRLSVMLRDRYIS